MSGAVAPTSTKWLLLLVGMVDTSLPALACLLAAVDSAGAEVGAEEDAGAAASCDCFETCAPVLCVGTAAAGADGVSSHSSTACRRRVDASSLAYEEMSTVSAGTATAAAAAECARLLLPLLLLLLLLLLLMMRVGMLLLLMMPLTLPVLSDRW